MLEKIHAVPALLALLLLAGPGFSEEAPIQPDDVPARPNILFIMSDDQGWGDVGYVGNKHIHTPHLDALAEESLRFERFYAFEQGIPSRLAALTGVHPARWDDVPYASITLPESFTTLAEVLRTTGYRTAHFGKWQLGHLDRDCKEPNWGRDQYDQAYAPPSKHGFEFYFSTRDAVPTFNPTVMPDGYTLGDAKPGDPFPIAYWDQRCKRVTDNLDGDDSRVIADRAAPFIFDAVSDKQPFFAAVWFHAAHTPLVASEEHRAHHADFPEKGQHYRGAITAMDEQIGRLLKLVDQIGAAENTLVIFCGDNGPRGKMDKPENGTTGGFRGRKNSFYEGGLRVPALMRWPGVIEPGRTSDTPVAILDLMPTVLDILNKPWPETQPREGETFLPHLCGQPWIRKAPLYFQRRYDHAIITQTHKALTTDNGRRWLLFDLLKDPRERYDIKSDDEERLERLVEEWERWKENGGPLPDSAPAASE